jgi:phospholipase/carboxylesterase
MNPTERIVDIAGLRTTVIGPADAALAVALLHGHAMTPADLTPFAHSLGLPVLFLFPQGPVTAPERGFAWWSIDAAARALALSAGSRDLWDEYPAGLPEARLRLDRFLEAAALQFGTRRAVVGGFSQGGMLAMDFVLGGSKPVEALVLMSSSRVALRTWQPLQHRLAGLPVLISHGRTDADLAFAAGEKLRDFAVAGNARLTWVPFDAGHEIPLVVWRAFRKVLNTLLTSEAGRV